MSARMTFDARHPKGFIITLALDADTLKAAVEAIDTLVPVLEARGWTPIEAGANGQGIEDNASDDPPICPTHGKAMQKSNFNNGGWFCPAKVADDDGTGKAVYCRQKA